MALTRGISKLSIQLLRNKACLYTAVRCSSDKPLPWNYLWKPEKYSEKDHDKIAEKYHLHPKKYQPYSNNEKYVGDYPKLPMIGPAAKDPYYPYDIPIFRKSYHETLHSDFEIMGQDRFSYGVKYRINPYLGSAIWLATMITIIGISYLVQPYPAVHPRLERQYPKENVIHYSFEPADS
ncbi:PREDICTED: NADH dehydrogenase [ubiquinone] 1 beta subcomplex subunit 8, mitochondrial [Cyphomyrmex costatus]|uniref:NADH dehydrogenase [ubiquinone] 1 beta subcomplex subunit 8, mitochondrial n=1 Tax=Cyphomyrmex costatus TaxID=456900 RepID=A0A195CLL2_9HYME|nr:PREDICTED: NADH dehydrogenase [ubiquinone] 1 beta subcomplex subunit 8, mitochondrial [Cyphomyrmex costatus]KYN01590.1 NADH dehydrogenase [ubiquinone] 1 beta subcomplex subunit 8, mitochondrial [Cyphomyrmex costatus]